MRFTLEMPPGTHLVTGVGPHGVRVGDQWHVRSLVVSAAELVTDWPVASAARLDLEQLAPVLQLAPEILLLGTGSRIHFPDGALFAALAARNIGLEVMDTTAACRTYNVLVNEGRPVVAALILP